MNLDILTTEIQDFITNSLQANISKLALSKNPFPEIDWKEIINQIRLKDRIIFRNIRAKGPDNSIRELNDINFLIL